MRITATASLLIIALSGCGSSESLFVDGPSPNAADSGDNDTGKTPLCIPGQQLTCACPGGEPGAQACREDGSGFLPCDCTGKGNPECSANTYKTPAVNIGLLPPHSSTIESSLNNTSPVGGTPTRHALEGALQYAKEWSATRPDHTVIVVLATDGEPSGCTGNSMTNIKEVASSYAAQGIKTFVIGIGNQTGNLDEIAAAGGTDEAIMVIGQNAQQHFIEAMNEIRSTARPCEYALPMPKPGEAIDLEKLDLRFTAGDGTKTDIPYVEGASQCGVGGWFYDDPIAPTKILTCPETCDVFKADPQGEVNVVLACERRGL